MESISSKDRRRITSVLHNANVERTKKLQAIQIQQQQNQQALQKQLQRQQVQPRITQNNRANQFSQNTNPQYVSPHQVISIAPKRWFSRVLPFAFIKTYVFYVKCRISILQFFFGARLRL